MHVLPCWPLLPTGQGEGDWENHRPPRDVRQKTTAIQQVFSPALPSDSITLALPGSCKARKQALPLSKMASPTRRPRTPPASGGGHAGSQRRVGVRVSGGTIASDAGKNTAVVVVLAGLRRRSCCRPPSSPNVVVTVRRNPDPQDYRRHGGISVFQLVCQCRETISRSRVIRCGSSTSCSYILQHVPMIPRLCLYNTEL